MRVEVGVDGSEDVAVLVAVDVPDVVPVVVVHAWEFGFVCHVLSLHLAHVRSLVDVGCFSTNVP